MAEEQDTQLVHAAHAHTCGFCGSAALQDQLEWPVGPLGGKQAFGVTCPDCGQTIQIEVQDGEWVSEKLVHDGSAAH